MKRSLSDNTCLSNVIPSVRFIHVSKGHYFFSFFTNGGKKCETTKQQKRPENAGKCICESLEFQNNPPAILNYPLVQKFIETPAHYFKYTIVALTNANVDLPLPLISNLQGNFNYKSLVQCLTDHHAFIKMAEGKH